ncbi:unnamed protein product [Pedinophyceae sp. YPF-701]|nr:unnamed protein product [Pedinophyceae sp. YPF-701]
MAHSVAGVASVALAGGAAVAATPVAHADSGAKLPTTPAQDQAAGMPTTGEGGRAVSWPYGIDASPTTGESSKSEEGADGPALNTKWFLLFQRATREGRDFTEAGKYKEAEACLTQAKAMAWKAYESAGLGEDHPQVAAAVHNLGELYRRWGQRRRAQKCFESAVASLLKTLGADYPGVAFVYNSIGHMWLETKELALAEEWLRRGYNEEKRLMGPNHRGTLSTQFSLGRCLYRMGRTREGLDLMKATVDGIEDQRLELGEGELKRMAEYASALLRGPDASHGGGKQGGWTGWVRNKTVSSQEVERELRRAVDRLLRAADLNRDEFPLVVQEASKAAASLGVVMWTSGRHDAARSLYEGLVRSLERGATDEPAAIAARVTALVPLAEICLEMGDVQEASRHAERALALSRGAVQGSDYGAKILGMSGGRARFALQLERAGATANLARSLRAQARCLTASQAGADLGPAREADALLTEAEASLESPEIWDGLRKIGALVSTEGEEMRAKQDARWPFNYLIAERPRAEELKTAQGLRIALLRELHMTLGFHCEVARKLGLDQEAANMEHKRELARREIEEVTWPAVPEPSGPDE